MQDGKAHEVANGESDGRVIGNGVVIGYVAAVGADLALVVLADLEALIGLVVFVAMWLVLLGADLYVQHLDMTGEDVADVLSGD